MAERPIHNMLLAAAGRVSGHMPGHKGQAPFGPADLYRLDTTELDLTDDLYHPSGAIADAQALYAQAAGAGASLFLHNGSTAGIHAMLQLWASEGDKVLLPRNAHLSAVNAAIVGGLQVLWMSLTQTADGYTYLSEETVLQALAEHPEAKAVLLTRPDFYGGCLPIRHIVAAAHAQGTRVVVDEAHGAHLPWLKAPASAGELGADAWVQSVHKTLPGLTGSAVLHLRETADAPAALRLIRRTQTSSPSFLLLRSMDDARAWMAETGAARLQPLISSLNGLRQELQTTGSPYQDAHGAWAATGLDFDPTRLVLSAPQGGERLLHQLQESGIDAEMADGRRVVLIFTAMDGPEQVAAVAESLRHIPAEAAPLPPPPPLMTLPEVLLSPRQAACSSTELVDVSAAEGRIAAQSAGLYPPGIPLVAPGERISRDIIQALRSADPHDRFGLEGDQLLCVAV